MQTKPLNLILEKVGEMSPITQFQQETYYESREGFIARQKGEGNVVVFPEPNELQLDIDTDEQYEIYINAIPILEGIYGFLGCTETTSRGGNKHITIKLPEGTLLSHIERIAFQAVLGSDPVRELLSLARALQGDIAPTLFIEKGEQ